MRHEIEIEIHEIGHDTYVDVIEEWRQRYGNGHLEIRKMKRKEANLFKYNINISHNKTTGLQNSFNNLNDNNM
jgi:hypothetical protein